MLPLAGTGPQNNSRESPKPTCGSHLLHGLIKYLESPPSNRFNHSHDSQCSFQGPSVFSDPMSPTSASWLDILARQSLDKWWQRNGQVLGRCTVESWCDVTKTKTMSIFLSSQRLRFPEGRKGVGDPSCSIRLFKDKTCIFSTSFAPSRGHSFEGKYKCQDSTQAKLQKWSRPMTLWASWKE